MADVNEALIKEAIRRAEKKALEEAQNGQTDPAADSKTSTEAKGSDAEDAEVTENSAETSENSAEAGVEKSEDNDSEADGAIIDENGSEDDGKKKINLFGRKDKKDKRDEQIAELNDKLMRNLAEFQNFRNRTEKEKSQMFELGAKSVVEKLLETIDNFERGLATVPAEQKEDPFVQGMDKVYKQMMTTLEGIGVKPIEAVGNEFDPNLHNAVMHVEDDNFGENIVCEEFQKGYMYRDTVVRHSMVKVAN